MFIRYIFFILEKGRVTKFISKPEKQQMFLYISSCEL